MSEHTYLDMTPEFTDVPCEGWDGADSKLAVQNLVRRAGLNNAEGLENLSLLALARRGLSSAIEPCTIARLRESEPSLLEEMQALREAAQNR